MASKAADGREMVKVLLDLPATALSPASVASWAKALNQRNFQDKILRVIQYGSRGLAYSLAQSDPKAVIVAKLTGLYKQISLSRKVFRGGQTVAHLHTSSTHLQSYLKDPSDEKAWVRALNFVQWLLFAHFIFWDNLVVLTHPSTLVINRPKSAWWNHNVVRQCMINARARSDLFAFAAAVLDALLNRRKRDRAKQKVLSLPTGQGNDEEANSALATAEAKCHDAYYPVVKYFSDVATYLPQASWAASGPWHTTRGWNDGCIGVMGVIAALCSCRSEWMKLK